VPHPRTPWARERAAIVGCLALFALGTLTACSTPASGTDTTAAGQARLASLLGDVIETLPASADATTPDAHGAVTCRKKFLGYAVGTTGKNKVEVPVIVRLEPGTDPVPMLDPIEQRWRDQGYTIDLRDRDDKRYPKVRARTPDGYELIATAITDQPKRLDLYGVSRCLRDG
jgi:hypothetical protein